MKHRGLSALLVLLLILLIPVTASADVIYPAPEDFTVGVEVNHLLATLDPGGTVWTDPELLPEGLRLETEETEEGVNVYLRGFPSTPGTYDLLFRYNDVESICTVNILPGEAREPVPEAITVFRLPLVTEYTLGDELNPEGLVLLVAYDDGSSAELTGGFQMEPMELTSLGTQSITVSYEELQCSFEVEVFLPEEIESIALLRMPEKVVYTVGEELDPGGLMIRVYSNRGTRDVYDELLCFPTQLDEPGTQEITVCYRDQMCSFSVVVLAEETERSLSVSRLPFKVDYRVGEELDTAGLVLIETDGPQEPRLVERGFTCYPTVFTEPGQQEVTVELDELSCSFPVTVLAPSVPEPSAAPAENPALPVMPATVSVEPLPETVQPRINPVQEQNGPGLVAVIVGAALAALLILGVNLFVINRSGREYFAESVKDLFRRKR